MQTGGRGPQGEAGTGIDPEVPFISEYFTNSFYARPRIFIQERYRFVASLGSRGLSKRF